MMLACERLSRPIALIGCDDLAPRIGAVLRGWRFREAPYSDQPAPVITIRKAPKGYGIESPWRPSPAVYRDRVDAVCSYIVDLIKALVADDPALLCLHAGGVEIGGRLVVFPSRYRAGKTTLAEYLAAAGTRVYADDVLPIDERANEGVAPGVQPRLRLPLPEGVDGAFRAFVQRRSGPANRRYLYLDLGDDRLASLGEQAPIGAFVLLKRGPAGAPSLTPVGKSEMLKRVILRNFATVVPAADILDRLYDVVGDAQCFALRYGDGAAAAALLKDAFGHWPPTPARKRGGPARRGAGAVPEAVGGGDAVFRRHPEIVERALGDELFLVDRSGEAIYHLNAISAALWRLLAEPTTVQGAASVLHRAFPDIAKGRIERDVRALLADLAARKLVSAAS